MCVPTFVLSHVFMVQYPTKIGQCENIIAISSLVCQILIVFISAML